MKRLDKHIQECQEISPEAQAEPEMTTPPSSPIASSLTISITTQITPRKCLYVPSNHRSKPQFLPTNPSSITGLQQHLQRRHHGSNNPTNRQLSPPAPTHQDPWTSLHAPSRPLSRSQSFARARLRILRCARRGALIVSRQHVLSQLRDSGSG